ncbi:MAG: excinuclease ABC subunit A [Nitrosospira sp.]
MKSRISIVLISSVVLIAFAPAHARDTKHMMPIAAAMADNNARERLGDTVKFYFANQSTPHIIERLGTETTSVKTNSVGKSAEKSCNWVFLSAMLAFQKRAIEKGANAVVNIVSNYNHLQMSSSTEFECHDGVIMSGVAFKGDLVKIGISDPS